ncbi:hypothetical protein C8Q74DRAFT_1222507 [Fomes fomentarius]|nr:hypothetical protein C8Q74DRAFT_1222507 [Fomes fomentarius]
MCSPMLIPCQLDDEYHAWLLSILHSDVKSKWQIHFVARCDTLHWYIFPRYPADPACTKTLLEIDTQYINYCYISTMLAESDDKLFVSISITSHGPFTGVRRNPQAPLELKQINSSQGRLPRYGRSLLPGGAVVPGAGLSVALGISTCTRREANVRRNFESVDQSDVVHSNKFSERIDPSPSINFDTNYHPRHEEFNNGPITSDMSEQEKRGRRSHRQTGPVLCLHQKCFRYSLQLNSPSHANHDRRTDNMDTMSRGPDNHQATITMLSGLPRRRRQRSIAANTQLI